ncbi:cytochrome c-type biogenesis protein CcmE-like protein, mitochondrial-like [Senna tora]|uniref:Cytochrome c-type biogenesis protein CcmE-like protein, mitochondrial-like n=1 Tax=Senna tora TaxID=362788 RepID=A0A834WP27_9FABA|nr:cytochrome c-type biogenesis protein CcmE-like protein, mitochondrial-like [Senna tora]
MASSRFRSHLLRTASFFHSSLLRHHHQPPPIRSPPLVVASLSDLRSILLTDSSSALLGRRFLSTARRQPLRSKKTVDIGARARQLQNRRLWTYALTFSCIAGFIVIVLNNFQDQLVFYITPTDALEKYSSNPSKNKFRLGGLVVEGSVVHPASSPEMEFVITDLITDMLVRYQGSLPDLFREGHSVVVEGFVKPFTEEIKKEVSAKSVSGKARSVDCYFSATEVLAKHDEKYMPQEVAAAIEKNKKMIEAGEVEQEGAKSSILTVK